MAISGFVVSYNRAALLGTCLRSLRFVDELIVIDKSSTDSSRGIARRYADRVSGTHKNGRATILFHFDH